MKKFLLYTLVFALAIFGGALLGRMDLNNAQKDPAVTRQLSALNGEGANPLPTGDAALQKATAGGAMADYSDVAQSVLSTIVGVNSVFIQNGREVSSLGSGVVVTSDGYILTNQHVVTESPKSLSVTLENGKMYAGQVMWQEKSMDLAIVKINETGLRAASLGDSASLRVGQAVLAVGNPLSMQFQRTVTAGIVSAKNRTINVDNQVMEDLIQTDAAINSGNSGGPLVNAAGEVIGINTVKVASAEGMGFAIPINVCKPIINAFAAEGKFVTPYLGVYCYDQEVTRYLRQDFDGDAGLLIAKIDENGPAGQAGLLKDDAILSFDAAPVSTMSDLRARLFAKKPGDKCQIVARRGEEKRTFTCTIGEK